MYEKTLSQRLNNLPWITQMVTARGGIKPGDRGYQAVNVLDILLDPTWLNKSQFPETEETVGAIFWDGKTNLFFHLHRGDFPGNVSTSTFLGWCEFFWLGNVFLPLLYLKCSIWSCRKCPWGTSLVVQWLRLHTPNAGDPSSIPGRGTRFHILHLRVQMLW